MTEEAGWEVEGFIERLTRRNDTNSERLVLEAIRHLRAFSRDCDALRESNRELREEIERLSNNGLASGGVVSANAGIRLFGEKPSPHPPAADTAGQRGEP